MRLQLGWVTEYAAILSVPCDCFTMQDKPSEYTTILDMQIFLQLDFHRDSSGSESHELASDGDSSGSEGHELDSKGDHLSSQLGSNGDHLSSGGHNQHLMGTILEATNRALSENCLSSRGPLRKWVWERD